MIRLSGIRKTFNPGEASEVRALLPLNLELLQGEFVVVIGANGSGKSTLLNLLAGSERPDAGTIRLDDTDITSLPDYRRSKFLGRVFQHPHAGTAPDLSILENFRLAALRTKTKTLRIGLQQDFRNTVQEQVAALQMGLEHKLDQPMGKLSGGQRQALTLLMSTFDSCRLLLMDEPTAALDPRSATIVMQLAEKIIRQQELTAVLITHQLKDCLQYGDRILFMKEGRVAEDISGEAKKQLKLQDLYGRFAD